MLECDRLRRKSTIPGRTTRSTTSCERRSTDYGQNCESLFECRDVISPVHVDGASQKSEDNLAVTEAELDKQNSVNQDLNKKLEELHAKTEEAARLKDQVDEYGIPRHFSGSCSDAQAKITTCCG